MNHDFIELTALARAGNRDFSKVPREACVEAARKYAARERESIWARHHSGESGSNVVRLISDAADTLVQGVAEFGLYFATDREKLAGKIAICALGGYGRQEMSPNSDLDVCLLYERRLDREIEAFNAYLLPFLWDMGFKAGYAIRRVSEAARLAGNDPEVFTAYAQSRLLFGDSSIFARMKMALDEIRPRQKEALFQYVCRREKPDTLAPEYRDLYHPEPDIKENTGGLRDYHAGLWILWTRLGLSGLDDLRSLGHISPDEYLQMVEALDFIWRIRNEIHFHTGKSDNVLRFPLQQHVAKVFGYGDGVQEAMDRFMRDYYIAAQSLRWFLRMALRLCEHRTGAEQADRAAPSRSQLTVYRGELCLISQDKQWFAENPVRLMEIIWQSERRRVPLSRITEGWIRDNLNLVGYAFRSSDTVRRYFVAICSRPLLAGQALRQAANAGLLAAYIPEFAAVQGIVRYADFHSYPVHEHTLRAIEALAEIPKMDGPVAEVLRNALERVRNPHTLVLAILMHDLGKVHGEEHAEASVRIARTVCARMGLPEEDAEQIEFLVRHHMLMTNIAFYRDTNDPEIVNSFAETMKTDERLRQLLLLTYADLRAVGPDVWNEWKGALLLKLFLKAERNLLGRAELAPEEDFWNLPKAAETESMAPEFLRDSVQSYLRAFGERYFVSYSPKHLVEQMACLEEARQTGLAMRCSTHEETATSEVVVCTRDRHGLFANIAGSFTAQLVDVQSAALFTSLDGWVVDCFTVRDAMNNRPLTESQFDSVSRVLRRVLLEEGDIQQYVDQSRKRLFALLQPRVPVRTRIEFDNLSSSTDTVIDIETGDRTGLLYDMARALAAMGVDIQTARIMTDARRVRDSFYVRMNHGKLLDTETQMAVRNGLEEAIQPLAAAGSKGGL